MTRWQLACGAGIGAMFLLGTTPGIEPFVALFFGGLVTAAVRLIWEDS